MFSKEILGDIAVFITIVGYAPYFWSIYEKRTKPHAFSWLVWAIVAGVTYVAQYIKGAGPGSWTTGYTMVGCFIIAGIAFFRGEKDITRGDWISLIAALATIPLWYFTSDPLWSVILATLIELLGFYPTIRKAYIRPHEENLLTYFLCGLKFAVAIAALNSYSLVTLLYPVWVVIGDWAFVAVVLWRRQKYKAI